ncbi:MAG: efflux RND transporter periplasmic adaptor subunit [Planctomycetaceae bacterium]|nr:MAG: efflux RND transporter periplasmic adaptor subunit [Planctomycetaceae bacterium]
MNWQSIRRWTWPIVQAVVAISIVAAGLYWYFRPIPVVEHQVETGELIAEVMGTGTLEARVKSTISPKIAGRIREIPVDQGDRVQAGQILFTLDDAELNQQVEIAQATIDAAKAALDRLRADQRQTEAVRELARQTLARTQKLVARNAATVEDSERATEGLLVAESGVAKAAAALIEGHSQVTTAEKSLAYHESRLADTRVAAPFDGLIAKRYRDPGDIGVPGSPILLLVSTAEIWVSAWVDETEMSRLQPGQPARVRFRSQPGQSYQGEISRLGREVDRETREFIVDVRVLTLPENWAVGQRAEVYIEAERHTAALLVPTKFIVWRDATPGVFRKVDNRSHWQAVTLGLRTLETAEVTDGLAAGETVAMPVAGTSKSLENQRVSAQ